MKIKKMISEYVWFFIPGIIALLFIPLPIEDFLSEYPFLKTFSWYISWRATFASLILWLITGLLYSLDEKISEKLLWGSLFSFLIFHYITLFIISLNGYTIKFYPFTYEVSSYINNSFKTLYLDTGQILLIITIAFSEKLKKIYIFIKNRLLQKLFL